MEIRNLKKKITKVILKGKYKLSRVKIIYGKSTKFHHIISSSRKLILERTEIYINISITISKCEI